MSIAEKARTARCPKEKATPAAVPNLARNTGWVLLGQGARLGVQAVYFIVIARLLGPKEYGGFGAVLAIASVLQPFSSLGFGYLMIRRVARDPSSVSFAWGNAIVVTVASGVGLGLLFFTLGAALLPPGVPRAMIAMIAAAVAMLGWAMRIFILAVPASVLATAAILMTLFTWFRKDDLSSRAAPPRK